MNKRNTDQIEINLLAIIDVVNQKLEASLVVELEINGSIPYPKGDVFDFELLRSCLFTDGDYFLINCSCGHPECTGRTKGVRLDYDPPYIYWEDLDYDKKWILEMDTLKIQIEEINKKEKELEDQFIKKGIGYKKLNQIWN